MEEAEFADAEQEVQSLIDEYTKCGDRDHSDNEQNENE